jgi:hypothetical protein
MTLHEITKQTMIIEEITGYFLEKGFSKIDLSIENGTLDTTFIIKVYDKNIKFVQEIREYLHCSREIELEEYALDMCVTDDADNVMQKLGMLIDKFQLEENQDSITLTLCRSKH